LDGALVAPPPACADTNPKDKIATAAAIIAMFPYIEFSVGLRRSICAVSSSDPYSAVATNMIRIRERRKKPTIFAQRISRNQPQ
jgi:hypothetical protein